MRNDLRKFDVKFRNTDKIPWEALVGFAYLDFKVLHLIIKQE